MVDALRVPFCGVRSGRIQPLSAVRADEALNLRPRCVRRSYPEISWSQVAASAVLVGFAYARASFARQDEKKDDWREFRARLVEQEKGVTKAGSTAEDTWLHGAKLLEKGSVLISHPGDHYSLDQQYFHKAVILIIKSDAGGDVGVILNRPTSWGIKDFGEASSTFEAVELHLRRLLGLTIEERPWKVSYGGPMCFEPGPRGDATLMCLHRERRNQRLKEGEEILNGLVLLPYNYARELVAMGQAQQEDFHLLSGYCGWAPGQLQDEVRNGGWQLLCAGSKALLPKTNQETLDESTSDGIEYWQSFQDALQAKTAPGSVGEQRADQALRRWIQQNLLKPPASAPSTQKAPALRLSAGTVLRGSASAWILGGQTTWRPRRNAHSRPPAQYLHKAVLLTITDVAEDEPAVLVILTGPQVGELPNGGKVFFGGLVPSERQLLQISGSYIWGQVLLPPHMLQELLLKGALEIAHGVKIQEVMDAPLSNRWAVAGGRLESINDAAAALLGDEQQRHWPNDSEVRKLLREAELKRSPTWVCANGCCGPWGIVCGGPVIETMAEAVKPRLKGTAEVIKAGTPDGPQAEDCSDDDCVGYQPQPEAEVVFKEPESEKVQETDPQRHSQRLPCLQLALAAAVVGIAAGVAALKLV